MSVTMTLLRRVAVVAVGLAAPCVLLQVPAAQAAARVSVTNASGAAVADPTYATSMRVSGSGFQSIKGGRGGIYVAFGTVKGTWRPSQGGITGRDYFYVPDAESGKNHGFQKYVAFPGSATSGEANGGVISASGTWSTSMTIPGSSFQAADRNGKVTTIDCTKVQCGIITLGAHGIKNGSNETFTPITFKAGTATSGGEQTPTTQAPDATATEGTGATSGTGATGTGADATMSQTPGAAVVGPTGKPRLAVDRASAKAGSALSFTAAGMTPGKQVTVVLNDGEAAAGPFLVGPDGTFAGVIQIPLRVSAGTQELRVFGTKKAPTLNFAIAASDADTTPVAAAPADATTLDSTEGRVAVGLTAGAALLVLLAATRLVLSRRRTRG